MVCPIFKQRKINLTGVGKIIADFLERQEARKNATREARILCRPVFRCTLLTDAPRKPKLPRDIKKVLRKMSLYDLPLMIDGKQAHYSELAGLLRLC
jgi:hypothetical protein